MNKRNLALVMFMLIAVLALSAFSWAPTHVGTAVYHLSERADYSAFFTAQSSVQSGLEADAARYTAMAKYYQGEGTTEAMSFHYTAPGR